MDKTTSKGPSQPQPFHHFVIPDPAANSGWEWMGCPLPQINKPQGTQAFVQPCVFSGLSIFSARCVLTRLTRLWQYPHPAGTSPGCGCLYLPSASLFPLQLLRSTLCTPGFAALRFMPKLWGCCKSGGWWAPYKPGIAEGHACLVGDLNSHAPGLGHAEEDLLEVSVLLHGVRLLVHRKGQPRGVGNPECSGV